MSLTILGIFPIKEIRTGGDRRYLELMELLAERGSRVYVIMNTLLDYSPRHFIKIALPIAYKRHGFPPGSYIFKREIKKNLEMIKSDIKEHIDFIHIHGDMYLKSAIFLKRKLGVPFSYSSRNNDIERDRIIRKYGGFQGRQYVMSFVHEAINRHREKQIARFADIISFQSSLDMGQFLVRTHCDRSKIVIIPNNIGLPRCRPEWEHRNSSNRVSKLLYVGSMAPSKGFSCLLSVLSLLKAQGFQNLHCHVLMRIENRDALSTTIREYGVENMVILDGFSDPFEFLADCDLMVYPVLYDAFPNAILEALHVGCPVIASRVGGIPDILLHAEMLFESGNIEEIAGRIERCITDNSFYQRLRSLCAERAAAFHFDWAERFENAMKSYKEKSIKGR